jgi:hypothetical protein
MKIILILLISLSLYAYNTPVNKLQLCEMYEVSFVTSAEVFFDTESCPDAAYSVLSFKQLLLTNCLIDQTDIVLAEQMNKIVKQCQKKQIENDK